MSKALAAALPGAHRDLQNSVDVGCRQLTESGSR